MHGATIGQPCRVATMTVSGTGSVGTGRLRVRAMDENPKPSGRRYDTGRPAGSRVAPAAGPWLPEVGLARPDDGRLRVAFDAAPARREPTGVGVYVRDLAMAHLARDADSVRLIGVRPDGPLATAAQNLSDNTYLRSGGHQRWLLARARKDVAAVGGHLAHFTNAAAPLRPGRPYVLTIQDLSLLRYPHYHPPLRVAAAPLTVIAAHRAAAVIVPSDATRQELRRLLHVSGRRVVVVPHAASTHVDLDPQDGPTAIATVRREMGLGDDPYLLSVSTLEPRKNHARLVRAFEALTARRPGLRLVLVGDPGGGARAFAAPCWRVPQRTVSMSLAT